MPRRLISMVVIALFAAVSVGADSCETTTKQPAQQEQAGSDPPPTKTKKKSRPKIDFELACDYVLGDSGESGDPTKGYRFIGGGTVSNTGDVPVRVRATFRWKQLGTSPITKQRIVKLKPGQDRDVNVTVPATADQIDLHQSADGDCSGKATILHGDA